MIYTNDLGARQVEVDYVVVDGTTVQAETGVMIYDRGTDLAALDGQDVVAGQQVMDVNGALRFASGVGTLSARYDANSNTMATATGSE